MDQYLCKDMGWSGELGLLAISYGLSAISRQLSGEAVLVVPLCFFV